MIQNQQSTIEMKTMLPTLPGFTPYQVNKQINKQTKLKNRSWLAIITHHHKLTTRKHQTGLTRPWTSFSNPLLMRMAELP